MKVSVVGLGVEGQKATISLLKRGYDVYSSDINRNINLSLLEKEPLNTQKLDLEIGSHNLDKIYKSDLVSVSPSLFKKEICKNIIEREIFISDILTKHKQIKTIAVTGTNGKTTTTHMIYHILKNEGYKVAICGNGGGGFSGYNELLLDTNENEYDYMIIEVCDMTLDFCNYVFDIDMVVVTNIGYDHMDVHKSIEHYTEEVGCFIENKVAILNYNDKNLQKIKNESRETYFFNTYKHELNLFGKFNLQNAEAARITCNKLGVLDENIINSLKTFESVEGRTIKINYNDNEIVSGKTDNVDALKAVLEEETATEVITMFKDKLAELTEFTAENIQPIFKQIMKDFKANKGIKLGGKSVYMPIRIALTGQMHGPDLAGLVEVLGYERAAKRIERTLA